MRWRGVPILAWAILIGSAPLTAADGDPVDLQQIVESSGEKFKKAFANRDPQALAALFTPEAEYVDSSGVVFHGRDAIEAEYIAAFEINRPGTLELELLSIRPVAEGVVVEDGLSTFTPNDPGPSSQMRYTVTHVKQADGSWLMASVRELESPVVTPHDRLLALEWLIGKWRDETDGQVVETEWKWSESGNFLEGAFRIRELDQPVMEGTHRVGWDAQQKQFRSWIFLSSGNFASGLWTTDEDDNWTLQLSGVTTDGASSAALMTYIRDGDDALGVYQSQRTLGGQPLPSRSIRVVRQPPPPAVTGAGQ